VCTMNLSLNLQKKVKQLKYGNPREPGVVVGPLIRSTQPEFIQKQVDLAVKQGARLLAGGRSENSVYLPTLLADVTQDIVFSLQNVLAL